MKLLLILVLPIALVLLVPIALRSAWRRLRLWRVRRYVNGVIAEAAAVKRRTERVTHG